MRRTFGIYFRARSFRARVALPGHMQAAINVDKLKVLFQSFREKDDLAFVRAAESIILQELAANHHASATELRRSLMATPLQETQSMRLAVLPKDRRAGQDLLFFDETPVKPEALVLSETTSRHIARLLEEHRKRNQLERFGYKPKAKLLFWGPPGCGKTFTARYLASELGLPIAVLRLSSVISSFVGDTAAHIHGVFTRAAATPMLLLIDEADAIGKNRDDANDVGELKRVVNSLLQAIDSFRASHSVLVLASNHQYLLDPALWRRFDDVVEFPMPDAAARARLLRILLNGVRFSGSLNNIVKSMGSMSYADVERSTIEAVKTMILEERSDLREGDVLAEARALKVSLAKAKLKNGASRR
jgi:SpoVK/Ycf46/Vps4 family AAA+-type ATPase